MSNDYLSDSVAWEHQRRQQRRSSERKLHNHHRRSTPPPGPSSHHAVQLSPPYHWSEQQQTSFSDESADWPYLSPDRHSSSLSVPVSGSASDGWSDTSSVIAYRNEHQLVPRPHRSNNDGLFHSVMGPDPRGLNKEEYDDIKQRISKIEDICLGLAKSGDSRDKRELADRKQQSRKQVGRTGNRNMAGAVYAQVLTDIIADILRGFSVDFVQTVIGKVAGKAF
ncbi:hypothetical protein HDK77DRAFT_60928 [Phyllosticta capitalensis]|uniref:Uncharacterized protein n=1 Tax=Phyllosticta capitalensis TaxID=121624 RepID=A0ABR1YA03_9PEZI